MTGAMALGQDVRSTQKPLTHLLRKDPLPLQMVPAGSYLLIFFFFFFACGHFIHIKINTVL